MMGPAMADGRDDGITEADIDAEPVDDEVDEVDEGRRREDVEVVAEPIRYPWSPLVALIVIAFVPALGLFVLHRWSDSEADEYEASRVAVGLFETSLDGAVDLGGDIDADPVSDDDSDDSDEDEAPNGVAPALSTSLLDYRRTPDAVASTASAAQLGAVVDPVLSFIGDRSCAAVAIDGVAVTSSNIDLPVIPASNQKLLVATAALDVLGPDYTFTTSVAVPAPVDGEVEGDIYLIGGGDPLLTSNDFPLDDPQISPQISVSTPTSFDLLADALVDAGITRIRGTVIGDGRRYDDEFTVDEWADGVAFTDAGPYDALIANDALVLGRPGRQDDPNAAAASEFVRLLNDRGISVDNGAASGSASTLVPVLATVQSAPMTDVVAEMLLNSDNNTAEMLLKEMGVATSGAGTRAAGLDAMVQALEGLGVPMEGVTPRDGSGLSSANRLTCAALLRIVQLAQGGPIDAALPVAGRSGTLAFEFADSPMVGRLRAKTGTLGNEPFEADPPAVKALAGYVDPPDDSVASAIEFVVIVNGPSVSQPNEYQPLWQALGDRFATYPTGPEPDSLGPR